MMVMIKHGLIVSSPGISKCQKLEAVARIQ